MENLESIVSIGFTDTLLTSIPPNIFGSLARAKRRKMDNDPNPIEPLSIFLSHNKFATLPVSLFRPFVKYNIEIKLISLGDNKLVSLPDGIFDNLMVNELSVANNKLSKFPNTKPYDKNNDFYPGVLDICGNKFRKDIKDYLLCDFNTYQYNTILEILGVIQAQAEN